MSSYAITKVLNLSPEIKNSLEAILFCGKYHIRDISECHTVFSSSERTAQEILSELSRLYPDTEIVTDNRYESWHYHGVFKERYQHGEKLDIGHVRIEYEYEWFDIELGIELKEKFEREMKTYYLQVDTLTVYQTINLDVHEDEEIIAEFTIDEVTIQAAKVGEMIEVSILNKN